MNHLLIAMLALYLLCGAFVCAHVYDKDGHHMPVHHMLLLVPFWPVFFLLPSDDQS